MKVDEELHWDSLRDDIADVQRPFAEDNDALRAARLRLEATAAKPRSRSGEPAGPTRFGTRRMAWVLAIAASFALGFTVWGRWLADRSLSFEVGADARAGEVGGLISAPPSGALPVRFSDGTTLSMESATQARISEVDGHGATIALEEGSLSAAVVHRSKSKWRVTAGPFTVRVTGTKFDVRWNAAERMLDLSLHEGSVIVTGPSLAGERRVSVGEHLRVSVDGAGATRERATASSPEPARAVDTPPGVPTPRAANEEPSPPSRESSNASGGRSSWKQLALAERYADALAAAESDNFQTICRRASAADLLLLADTARFAGASKRAEQAFRSVRQRFAGAREAAVAAFSLGRIAYDDRRAYSESAEWFRTYLREEPNGALAREAAGRLIEAHRAAGSTAEAREAARAYLAQYPGGPHAALARSVGAP